MDSILDANWTVAQTMSVFPKTVSAFIALKTDCVGCPLAKFCTLAEAADAYQLPREALLQRLREAFQPSSQQGERL